MQYVLFNPQAGNGSGAQQARALDARFPEETFSYTDMTTISDYAAWLGTLHDTSFYVFSPTTESYISCNNFSTYLRKS